MKKFQILASTHPTAKDVYTYYLAEKCLDMLHTSNPVWVEADSLAAAKELFMRTDAFMQFSAANKHYHFYCNDGNWNLIQC